MPTIKEALEYSEIDLQAVDALFKRLAERGHRIRSQKQSADSNLIESPGAGKGAIEQSVPNDENEQDS